MDSHPASEHADGTERPDRPVRQLDTIIENLATYAAPVVREIAARAAELAAKAGQAAGPIAQRAADKTEAVGGRVADKGREIATDLRRDTSDRSSAGQPSPASMNETPDPRPDLLDPPPSGSV